MTSGYNAVGLITPDSQVGSGGPAWDTAVETQRCLVVANKTLLNHSLLEAVAERCARGLAELHVLVPQPRRIQPFVDPVMGASIEVGVEALVVEQYELAEATHRLDEFSRHFAFLGSSLRGQVVLGDPIPAVRRLGWSEVDEIIVSTLPPGLSRWLRMDLPARLARAFDAPVMALTQAD